MLARRGFRTEHESSARLDQGKEIDPRSGSIRFAAAVLENRNGGSRGGADGTQRRHTRGVLGSVGKRADRDAKPEVARAGRRSARKEMNRADWLTRARLDALEATIPDTPVLIPIGEVLRPDPRPLDPLGPRAFVALRNCEEESCHSESDHGRTSCPSPDYS